MAKFWLHYIYIPAFKLHSDYILTTFWLYSEHILATFLLHSDITNFLLYQMITDLKRSLDCLRQWRREDGSRKDLKSYCLSGNTTLTPLKYRPWRRKVGKGWCSILHCLSYYLPELIMSQPCWQCQCRWQSKTKCQKIKQCFFNNVDIQPRVKYHSILPGPPSRGRGKTRFGTPWTCNMLMQASNTPP